MGRWGGGRAHGHTVVVHGPHPAPVADVAVLLDGVHTEAIGVLEGAAAGGTSGAGAFLRLVFVPHVDAEVVLVAEPLATHRARHRPTPAHHPRPRPCNKDNTP